MPEVQCDRPERGGQHEATIMLNPAQRRVVLITLQQLERALADQEHLLQPEEPLTLKRRVLDIDADAAATLRSLAAAARREIQQLAGVFGFQSVEESTRRILQVTLSVLWADLEDTRPQKLLGYGEVDPAAASQLEPALERLIALVQAMQSVLEGERLPKKDGR